MLTVLYVVSAALFLSIAMWQANLLSKLKAFSFLNSRGGRNQALDGIRGFLALSVFFHHMVITWYWKNTGAWELPPQALFQNFGKVGVAIFFMITGFLFISKIADDTKQANWPRLFQSRVFRIYPLYLFAMALVGVIAFHETDYKIASSPSEFVVEIGRWLAFHGGTINGFLGTKTIISGVDWTLKYEVLFYVSLPIVALAIKRFPRTGGALILSLVALGALFPQKFIKFDTEYFILFAIGAIAFYATKYTASSALMRSPWASLVASVLLMISLLYPSPYDWAHLLGMAGFFLLLVSGNDLFGLLSRESSALLGEVSYSIYLLHGIVIYILFTVFDYIDATALSLEEFLLLTPAVMLLVILLASATYLVIERPFIGHGRKVLFYKKQDGSSKRLPRSEFAPRR